MMRRLEIQDVTIRFGSIEAVKHMSFHLGDDELVALIGPNGAGKTALLNSICGIYTPAEGDILLDGSSLVGMRPDHIAQRGIGRAFQNGELFEGLSVIENLMVARGKDLPGSSWVAGAWWGPYHRAERRALEEVEEIIDFFEIERYRHTQIGSLPFGVQKLVGVARALTTNPSILLLDEPSSGLTRQEKEDFSRYLLRIRLDRGTPVLWIEHDMQMVMDLADRAVVLDYGRKIAEGPTHEVADDPEVAAAYLGGDAASTLPSDQQS